MSTIKAKTNIEIVPEFDTKNLDEVIKMVSQLNEQLERTTVLVSSLKKAFCELEF